jgi:hypothetical protein
MYIPVNFTNYAQTVWLWRVIKKKEDNNGKHNKTTK